MSVPVLDLPVKLVDRRTGGRVTDEIVLAGVPTGLWVSRCEPSGFGPDLVDIVSEDGEVLDQVDDSMKAIVAALVELIDAGHCARIDHGSDSPAMGGAPAGDWCCERCGSDRSVGVTLKVARTLAGPTPDRAARQCVPCGYVDAGHVARMERV